MCRTVLTCYIESNCIESLISFADSEYVMSRSKNGLSNEISPREGHYRLLLHSTSSRLFNTDCLAIRMLRFLGPPLILKKELNKYNLSVVFAFHIKDIGPDDSVPSPGFNSAFLSFSEIIKPKIEIRISANVIEEIENNTCKIFFHIHSTKEMNISIINAITGTKPSLYFGKGDCYPGGHKIQDYYCWSAEEESDDGTPDKSIKAIMDRIKNPKELGAYCKKNKLRTHIVIYYGGIYSRNIEFSIYPEFLHFCHVLNLLYLDFDFLI